MANVVLVTSNKGGTGKTTTAINMGLAAAYEGMSVGLIDFDPQRSLDSWVLRRRNLKALPQVSIYAGSIERYAPYLAEASQKHELVIVDTPPSVSEHARAFNGLIDAADFILVPTLTGSFDLQAVGPWMKDHLQPTKGYKAAFVLNRIAMRSVAYAGAYDYLNKRGRICGAPIRNLTSIEQRMITGHSVLDNVTEDKGKEDFIALWTWVSQELVR